jgi:hypothetical protein
MSKRNETQTQTQTVAINVGSSKAPNVVNVPQAFHAAGRQHGLDDKSIGKAWLAERSKAFQATRTLSGAHREQDTDLAIYRAKVALAARKATLTERVAEGVSESLAKARFLAGLDSESRKLLGLDKAQTETTETTETATLTVQ